MDSERGISVDLDSVMWLIFEMHGTFKENGKVDMDSVTLTIEQTLRKCEQP